MHYHREFTCKRDVTLADPRRWLVGWLVVLRIDVDLAIFQPYLDLEAGDNQSLKIQVARPGIEPRSSCSVTLDVKSAGVWGTSTNREIFFYKYFIFFISFIFMQIK